MSLKDQINQDIKSAMKSKEMDKVQILRFLNSAIKNKEIEVRPNEITKTDIISVIKKTVKQLKESIEQYQNANRNELAEKEKKELEIIENYLPKSLSEEEINSLVDESIKKLNVSSIKDMGKVMKSIIQQTEGTLDNKKLSDIVKSKLN